MMLCCLCQWGKINSHPELGLLTRYRQILIKSKHTWSLNIDISGREKKMLRRVPSVVLKYDRLLSYELDFWENGVTSLWNDSKTQKAKQPLAYWPRLWTNINWIFIVWFHTSSITHIPLTNTVTTLKVCTRKWKVAFWGCILLVWIKISLTKLQRSGDLICAATLHTAPQWSPLTRVTNRLCKTLSLNQIISEWKQRRMHVKCWDSAVHLT